MIPYFIYIIAGLLLIVFVIGSFIGNTGSVFSTIARVILSALVAIPATWALGLILASTVQPNLNSEEFFGFFILHVPFMAFILNFIFRWIFSKQRPGFIFYFAVAILLTFNLVFPLIDKIFPNSQAPHYFVSRSNFLTKSVMIYLFIGILVLKIIDRIKKR